MPGHFLKWWMSIEFFQMLSLHLFISFFSLICWCGALHGLIFKYWIPRIQLMWSWCVVLFIRFWIWCTNIVLRTFVSGDFSASSLHKQLTELLEAKSAKTQKSQTSWPSTTGSFVPKVLLVLLYQSTTFVPMVISDDGSVVFFLVWIFCPALASDFYRS